MIKLPSKNGPGKIPVSYERTLPSLQVDVEYDANESYVYNKNTKYSFRIAPNTKGLPGFKAVDIIMPAFGLPDNELYQLYTSEFVGVDLQKKIGKLSIPQELRKRMTNEKYLTFEYRECQGFSAANLNEGCVLAFNVAKTRMRHIPVQAMRVQIPLLPYRWEQYDEDSKKWRAQTRATSLEFEKRYGAEYKETDNSAKIRRSTRFKGEVLEIDQRGRRGRVRINYSDEYGKEIGLWFNFRDCKFNTSCLRVGVEVEYSLLATRPIKIKLELIPYRWRYRYMEDVASNKQDITSYTFSYNECREIEAKYNPDGNFDPEMKKNIQLMHNNQLVTAWRTSIFRSKAHFVELEAEDTQKQKCLLDITYSVQERLGIRIPYIFPGAVPASIRTICRYWVDFEIRRDAETQQWVADNVRPNEWHLKTEHDRQNPKAYQAPRPRIDRERAKHSSIPDITQYESWSVQEIMMWVLSLEDGRFGALSDALRNGVIESEIKGADLPDVDYEVLSSPPFSIKTFKDKRALVKHFQSLRNAAPAAHDQQQLHVQSAGKEGEHTAYI